MRLLGTGLFTGKNGMMVVMLITSVVLIWLGLMALRLRVAIIRSLSEASSNILDKFILPSEGGGGGGGGSLSGALSASSSGSGGGGAIGNAAATTMQSAGATAGSTLTKAALTGGAVAGGGMAAGKMFGGGGSDGGGGGSDEHKSVATGDGSMNPEVSATASGSEGGEAVSEAGSVNAVSNVSAGASDMYQAMSQDAMDKQQAEGLMSATSLASASGEDGTSMMNARAGESGPASGMSAEEASAVAYGNDGSPSSSLQGDSKGLQSGQAGPASGMTVSEAAANAKAMDGTMNGTLSSDANADLSGELRTAQAADSSMSGYMAVDANGNLVYGDGAGSVNADVDVASGIRGVSAAPGEAGSAYAVGQDGALGKAGNAYAEGAQGVSSMGQVERSGSSQNAGLKGIQGQALPESVSGSMPGAAGQPGSSSGRDVRGVSIGQAAMRAREVSGSPSGQGRSQGMLDRSFMQSREQGYGQYRNSALAHGNQNVPVRPGSDSAGASGVNGRDGVSSGRGHDGFGMAGSRSSDSSVSSPAYRNSSLSGGSRYAMPGRPGVGPSVSRGGVGTAGGNSYAGGRSGGNRYSSNSVVNNGYRQGAVSGAKQFRPNGRSNIDSADVNGNVPNSSQSVPENGSQGVRGVNVGNTGVRTGSNLGPGQFGSGMQPQGGSYRRGSSDRFV